MQQCSFLTARFLSFFLALRTLCLPIKVTAAVKSIPTENFPLRITKEFKRVKTRFKKEPYETNISLELSKNLSSTHKFGLIFFSPFFIIIREIMVNEKNGYKDLDVMTEFT